MLMDSGMDDWHGVFVLTGDEDNVKERVKYRLPESYRVVVPKRKLRQRKGGIWSIDTKLLFPGYVLISGDISNEIYYQLKNIPNMIRLLKTGSTVASIDRNEMAVISRLISSGEEIGFSSVLVENGRVRVMDGPLFSMEGVIVKIDQRKERAKVRLNFLGEERTVDLGISVLRQA